MRNTMKQFTFTYREIDEETGMEVRRIEAVDSDIVSLSDVGLHFMEFMRGCGYQLYDIEFITRPDYEDAAVDQDGEGHEGDA